MRRLDRDRAMALGFIVLSFVLAFWQRPGKATSDTKIDLHVSPGTLLEKVASVWTPSIDLGAVHGAQYGGYLWPMGPVFALPHELGVTPWVTHRIWLGLLFAFSAWGVLRLLDRMVGRPRGVVHLVAAAFYLFNPYTVMFTGRTSLILLGYAAMPWMILVVFHGVRAAGRRAGWWWAAAFALVLTSVGGGINGAVVGWMLVGPLLLLIYEPLIGSVRWRDSLRFLVRMGVLGTLASLWWIAPLVVHAGYGIDFLQFTEQPRTIWATNSAPEALRLMAYWTSYVGSGFGGPDRAFFTEAGTMLFNPFVVAASLLLPALAVLGFMWTRGQRYAPFFLFVLLVGVGIEVAGFPDGTPSRDAMEWIYRNVPLVRFMRTTQKAAPLVALGVAGLLGMAAQVAWYRVRALRAEPLRRVAIAALPLSLAGLILVGALPLTRGTAVEKQLTWDRIPAAWTQTGAELDEDLPRNTRALVLPGQIFGYYDWGGTVDAILPRLTKRPVAVRYETPYGDPHATDLLWTIDRFVGQRRLVPGQLRPLLGLIGAGSVVTGSDDDIRRSGALAPAAAAAALEGQGLGEAARTYGPERTLPPLRGDLDGEARLPQVRRYDVGAGRGIVSVAPTSPVTIVDGGAEGLAGLAAFGALPRSSPIFYAGDLSAAELRDDARRGAELVVTDSNRRRRFVAEFGRQNLGGALRETEPLDENFALIDPFPDRGSDSQTVAALDGASYLRSPYEGGLFEFPEHAPFAAFDGDRSTTWVADRYFFPGDRWLEVGFESPRDIPSIELEPTRDPYGVEREVDVNGVRARLGPGITRVPLGLKDVTRLRITITEVDQPGGDLRGGGGFREIRIPGVRIRQRLRPPLIMGRALAGRDLERSSLSYVFERTTADDPFLRDRETGSPQLELTSNREDAERQIQRVVFSPASRTYSLDAWVHPAADAPDSALDRLTGLRSDVTFDSSGRFHDQGRYRASSAFDSDPDTAWIGIWAPPSAPQPWIAWRSGRPLRFSELRVDPARRAVRRPSLVRLRWDGGSTPPLRVAGDGTVALPQPVRGRDFRLTVLEARFPAGAGPAARSTRTVGIGKLSVPGLDPVTPPRAGPLRGACGDVRVMAGGDEARLMPLGSVADLDAGRPLRARGCGGDLRMGAGIQEISTRPGTFSVDWLRMRSDPARPLPAPSGGGEVVDPGTLGKSSVDGVKVALDGPSWLVLGQSFSRGWEATCDGKSLGEPHPINGYANGWRAPAGCSEVAFDFGPQRSVLIGFALSGVVCLVLLAFLAAGFVRRRGREPAPRPPEPLPFPAGAPTPIPLPRAAAYALLATLPLAGLFAARSALAIFPVLTLILWRGVSLRVLTGVAAGLVGVAVPVLYAIYAPRDRGGFNFEYSVDLIWAHWTTVAAVILLAIVCWRTIASARAGPQAPREVFDPRGGGQSFTERSVERPPPPGPPGRDPART